MKLNRAFLVTLAAGLAWTAGNLPGAAPKPPSVVSNATNRFTITGMHCDGCASGLTSELKRAPGVASATVTLTNRLAVVAFDTNRTTTAKLIQVVEEAGFKPAQASK